MQVDVSVPVAWPTQTRLDDAWRLVLAEALGDLPELRDEVLQPGDGGSPWRLTSGTHLAPGARYRLEDPELTVGDLTLALDGDARRTTIRYDDHPGRDRPGRADRTMVLELDGLDACRSLHSRADLGELTWRVDGDLSGRRLDAEVELPWARAEARLTTDGRELRLRLEVTGRGLWRPTVAPLLAAAKGEFEKGARETVEDLAASLGPVDATGRFGEPPRRHPTQAERIAACEAAWAEVHRRLMSAEDAVAAEPWWRRSGKRWRAAYDTLRPASYPTEPFGYMGSVAEQEAAIAGDVARRRRHRRTMIDRRVTTATDMDLRFLRSLEASASPTGFRLRDADLANLHHLASPWSLFRGVKDAAAGASGPG